jgi:hypothetical protein
MFVQAVANTCLWSEVENGSTLPFRSRLETTMYKPTPSKLSRLLQVEGLVCVPHLPNNNTYFWGQIDLANYSNLLVPKQSILAKT